MKSIVNRIVTHGILGKNLSYSFSAYRSFINEGSNTKEKFIYLSEKRCSYRRCHSFQWSFYRPNCLIFSLRKVNYGKKPLFSFSSNLNELLNGREKSILFFVLVVVGILLMKNKVSKLITSKKGENGHQNNDSDVFETSKKSNYSGPKLDITKPSSVSREYISYIIERQKKQQFLEKEHVIYVLNEVLKQFENMDSLVDVSLSKNEITVCGDTHGQFYDTLNIFKLNGFPSTKNPYMFNGDFVDRGKFSFENVITLLAFKAWNPNCIHLIRGNHEWRRMNRKYGFEAEVVSKYGEDVYDLFQRVFNALPLCYRIDKRILVLHGGVGFEREDVTLEDIRKLPRNEHINDHNLELHTNSERSKGLIWDILWSDPRNILGRTPSSRGGGCFCFGPDIAEKFMDRNGLDLIIRSHEFKMEGYEFMFDGKLITLFSSPNYCDKYGNLGAYVRIGKLCENEEMEEEEEEGDGDDNWVEELILRNRIRMRFFQFDSVPHPKVKSYVRSERW